MNCFQIGGKDAPYLALQLREAAKLFQMIPEVTRPLVIPWGDNGKKLCDRLRWRDKSGLPLTRAHYRKTQRFTVQVYEREWKRLLPSGRLEPLHEGAIHLLIHPENDYDEAFRTAPAFPSRYTCCFHDLILFPYVLRHQTPRLGRIRPLHPSRDEGRAGQLRSNDTYTARGILEAIYLETTDSMEHPIHRSAQANTLHQYPPQ